MLKGNIPRSYLALFFAALLPVVMFASAIAIIIGFREQATLEATALSKVREIAAGIDRYMAAQLAAARVMAQAESLRRGDLEMFYHYAARLQQDEPAWSDIVVSDRNGRQLINLARPFGAPLAGVSDPQSFQQVLAQRSPLIGDLAEPGKVSGKRFIPIRVPVFQGSEIKYIVSVALDPIRLSSLFALADAPPDWVGAVIDRNGILIGRSVLADQLVGKKATGVALEAIKHGNQGIYEGYTLEGLDTVFAFHTSPLTGWSVHYAVPRSTYNAPLRKILWILGLGAVATVFVAFILFTIITREGARRRALEEAQSEALERSEARLRSVFETSYQYQGLLSTEGILLDANPASLAGIEARREDVVGKPFWDTPWFSGTPGMPELVKSAIPLVASGRTVRQEIAVNLPTGFRVFDFSMRPVRNTADEIIGIVPEAMEVTERRAAEEQLRQSQKMEALGKLTGGIAHDFNNMLTGIAGSIDMIRRRMAAGRTDGIDRYLDAATTSTQRAAALTHRLLAFSRQQALDIKSQDINALVEGLEEILRRTLGEKVSYAKVLQADLWPALTDANQLDSALLNLAINARDAMPEGGQLTIETTNTHLDTTYALLNDGVEEGDYVAISVSDTGTGMPDDVIEKAFDPFFTTKPIGQGTGLGLSMIYGFMKQSGGHVRIYSEPGKGTTVKLYLRRALNAAVQASIKPDIEAPRGGGETVLVVEDDATVRLLITELLEELGYRYIEVADPRAAIPHLQSDGPIDLLVTDFGLPNMNGRELADIARQHRPNLKVLFITGYAENAAIRAGLLPPGMEVVTKPFAFDALGRRIRDMITRPFPGA